MKRPQNHGQIAMKGPCQLKSGTSASARTQSGLAAAAALQQPWKALSGEIGNGASVLGKLTEQVFRQSDALSKGSHEPRFLPLLMPRGALESATVTTALICELMCE